MKFNLLPLRRTTPIGVDLGTRSVKLVQFDADQSRVLAAARGEVPFGKKCTADEYDLALAESLRQAREGQDFKGREAVLCLGARELFVQNIRVPKLTGEALDRMVIQEASGRLPFPAEEAEIRYIDADDVRQGDTTKREVIVLACHRPLLERTLSVIERGGFRPVAVDVEPLALLRCYSRQFRRDADREQRCLLVHTGASNTAVVISRGGQAVFVKYLDLGGKHLDEAVARHLKMGLNEAASLRRHNGDRRVDQQDPEVTRSVAEAVRPVIEKLCAELSLCIRYHSVTFRGQSLERLILGGGEACPQLLEALHARLDMKCELGEPLRSFETSVPTVHRAQWDVAAGLALRQVA